MGTRMSLHCHEHRFSGDGNCRRRGDDSHIGREADLPHETVGFFQIAGIVTHEQRFDILEYPELLGVQGFGRRIQLAVVAREYGGRT
jgi:hypothetical protein